MKRGFTILELLAASLLLSMLVTAVAMMFNQSSIAWRTGIACVVDLEKTREQLGAYHEIEDDILPGLGQKDVSVGNRATGYRTVSIFKNWDGRNEIKPDEVSDNARGRLYDSINWNSSSAPEIRDDAARIGRKESNISGGNALAGSVYVVGVKCAGPDKVFGTPDDISTLPEEGGGK